MLPIRQLPEERGKCDGLVRGQSIDRSTQIASVGKSDETRAYLIDVDRLDELVGVDHRQERRNARQPHHRSVHAAWRASVDKPNLRGHLAGWAKQPLNGMLDAAVAVQRIRTCG